MAGNLEEIVNVTILLKDMFSARAKQALRNTVALNDKIARSSIGTAKLFTHQFQALGNNIKQFNASQRRTSQLMVNQKVLANQNATAIKSMFESSLMTRVRLLSNRMKQFKMELLGIMFFGMMVQKTMFGLLRPAGDAVGIFEIWTSTLQIFFLPIMLALLPIMLMFMDWFIDAPEWLKLAIGGIVLFIGSLGALLFTYGAMSLGIRALMRDLPTFFNLFSSFTASSSFKDIFIKGKFLEGIKSLEKSMAARNISMLIGIGISIYWLKTVIEMMTDVETAWSTRIIAMLSGVFAGAFLGFKVAGVGGAVVGATIGFGISIVLNLLDIAWEHGVDEKMISGFSKVKNYFMDAWDNVKRKWLGSEAQTYIDAGGTLRSLDSADDFVWRAGQGITKINPNDNLVGTKGGMPGGGGVNITQNISVTASNKDEIDRLIAENNSRLVDDLRRMTGA